MTPQITAGMVAAELRRLADALDKEPDAAMISPLLAFYAENKEQLLNAARLLPKPLIKTYTEGEFAKVRLDSPKRDPVWYYVQAARDLSCTITKPATPAVYECLPLLSAIEEAQLEGAA